MSDLQKIKATLIKLNGTNLVQILEQALLNKWKRDYELYSNPNRLAGQVSSEDEAEAFGRKEILEEHIKELEEFIIKYQ